jgi:long-chain acyl-CoA synthetase
MSANTLPELLRYSAARHPKRTAIVFGQKRISYKALDEATDTLARGLAHLGIRTQDKIALFLDNCPEFVIGYFASLKAGAVVVPVNYMFRIEETKFVLEDSQATCLITARPYIDMAEELLLRVPTLTRVITTTPVRYDIPDFDHIRQEGIRQARRPAIHPQDLAVILYTSGTTGHPKGAMLSHRNLISNARDASLAIRVSHRDTFICFLPLFHSFAATVCMNLPLLVGACIVVMKSVRPFKRLIRSVRRNKVTIFVGIPSVYTILKDVKLPRIFRTPLIKLFNPVRVCVSGAAALPVETFRGFEKKFRIPLIEGYGLTEASPVVTINPVRGPRKPGSIGVSLSKSIEVKVVDEKGGALGPDDIGELIVRGPNVMKGYYRQSEATAETVRDGWLYTGDMARFDRDGFFYIAGRKKEMINVRGLNVYPREIEEVLYQHQKIKEAAVIGLPDPHKGEVPKGFVVLKSEEAAAEQEIIHYLRERLAPYKIPKYIEFRSSLPKNTAGKILKRVLLEEEARR